MDDSLFCFTPPLPFGEEILGTRLDLRTSGCSLLMINTGSPRSLMHMHAGSGWDACRQPVLSKTRADCLILLNSVGCRAPHWEKVTGTAVVVEELIGAVGNTWCPVMIDRGKRE